MKHQKLLVTIFVITFINLVSNASEENYIPPAQPAVTVTARREVVDKIVARVNGRNILLSDLKHARIDKGGGTFSVEEAIEHELLHQRASERKLLPTAIDVEKYIDAWKEMHQLTHMTEEEFEERLHEDGLTSKQYRAQLARILAIRNLRQVEVSERVIITAHEVEKYYKNNPEYSDDRYLLQTRIVPFRKASTEQEAIANKDVSWLELDWIDHSNLAERMLFVADLKVDEISKPLKVSQGYQFIKLIKKDPKHLKTIDERWVSIERELQKQKTEGFEKEYVQGLRKKAAIVYL